MAQPPIDSQRSGVAMMVVSGGLFVAIALVQVVLIILLYHRTEASVERVITTHVTSVATMVVQEMERSLAQTPESLSVTLAAAARSHHLEQALIIDDGGRLIADAAGGVAGTLVSGLVVARDRVRAVLTDDRLVVGRPLGAQVPTRMVYAPLHRDGQRWAVLCLELSDPLPGIAAGLNPPFLFATVIGIAIAALLVGLLLVAQRALARSRWQMEQVHGLARAGSLAAAIAHEVKNPLGLVLSSAQLLATSPRLDDGERATLRQIEDGVRRADDELNGYLDLVRDMPLKLAAVDLAALAADGIELLRAKASHHAVNIMLDAPKPVAVQGDRRRLHQMLVNIVLNAIQAQADSGGMVRITVRSDGGDAVIRIADDGPGIPPAMAGRLFEPFSTSKPDGTGLGLSMAKRTCERHGGSLRLLPTAGGAEFAVRLPLSEGIRP